jgi:hypothetical protein
MIFEKVEAGRGGDLAPAPEIVSADTPEYSPALITKQAGRSADLLFQWLSSTHAARATFRPDMWIPIGVPADTIAKRLRDLLGKTVQEHNDEVPL